jgi:hypothetical protein
MPNTPTKTDTITATTITDNPTGYTTTLTTNSPTDNCLKPIANLSTPCSSQTHKINPASGTIATPSTLNTNQWGATTATTFTNSDQGDDSVWFAIPNNLASPTDSTIATSTSPTPTTGTSTAVTFGTKVDYSIPAGTYQTTVVFTTVANAYTTTPTITNITPNSGLTTANTPITITGTNLDTAYQVFIDLNGNGDQDSGEECANANIDSITQITCQTPTTSTAGTYNTIIKTWGGTTDTDPSITTDDYTYNYPVCQSGNEAHNLCQINLDDNMIPVAYTGDPTAPQWTVVSDTATDGGWYDYAKQKWANAVTVTPASLATYQDQVDTVVDEADILGYFTYIPRYAYEVMRPNAIDKVALAQNFDIRFETATTPKKTPADTCSPLDGSSPKDYRTECGIDCTYGAVTNTTWATHPAFTFGAKELNGIWVGKFESSNPTTSRVTDAANIYIKPNQLGVSFNNVSTQFTMARNIGSDAPSGTSTHNLTSLKSTMSKNTDWGAVAYLATSIYGRGTSELTVNACNNDVNNTQIGGDTYNDHTGWGGSSSNCSILNAASLTSANVYNGTNGIHASTTDNIYGIYDMSGGNWEYQMAVYTDASGNPLASSSGFSAFPDTKYYNIYSRQTTFTNNNYYTNNNQCTFQTCGGQALHETKTQQPVSSSSQSWGSDYSDFVYSSYPWFIRGGASTNGSLAGLFASYYNDGNTNRTIGFRVVLGEF